MVEPEEKNEITNIFEACELGNIDAFYKFLENGHSVHELSKKGLYLLSIVCSAGHYDLASILLKLNVDVEAKCLQNGCSSLVRASVSGFLDIVKLLLSYGANVNSVSIKGMSSLMYACKRGHVEVAELLLSFGANLEDRSNNGYTPLMFAASAGHCKIVKILIDHGAIISTYCKDFLESPLTLACLKGHLVIVEMLLKHEIDHKNVNEDQLKQEELFDALTNTAIDGHIEIAKVLFKHNVNINLPSSIINCFDPPLNVAACGGYRDLALLFIDHGAQLNAINYQGYTPLMQASLKGYGDIVFILLYKGACIDTLTEDTEETALSLACYGGYLYVVDILVSHGANLELGTITPLMRAIQQGHLDIITYLLQCGADVHAQTLLGETPLFYACKNGNTNAAMMLYHFEADLEHISDYGYTPLMTACKSGHLSTVHFLISENASFTGITNNAEYHTPLSLACVEGHHEIVKFLLANIAMASKIYDNNILIFEAATNDHIPAVRKLVNELFPLNNIKKLCRSIITMLNVEFTPTWNKKQLEAQSTRIIEMLIVRRSEERLILKELMVCSLLNVHESTH